MDPHERAVSVWYRIAGLISREQKSLAVEIIEAAMRSAQHELLLEAARLVLSGEPVEIALSSVTELSGPFGPKGPLP